MNIHIETERLIIRDIEHYDVEGMYKLDSDPEVHKYLGNNPIKSIDEAAKIIEHVRKQYEQNGVGRWAIINKKTDDFIGWTGLKLEDGLRKGFKYYDLGYRLRKEYWGKGIARESAIESLKYGFEYLNLKEIGAAADIEHKVSNRILTSIGLKFVDTFKYVGVEHNWYKIERAEWIETKRTANKT